LFEHFNEEARLVIIGAQQSAKSMNQSFIAPEHMFFSIINLKVQTIIDAFHETGIDIQELKKHLQNQMQEWESEASKTVNTALPLTRSGKRVLELSSREAMQTGKIYVQAEHIFLAILRTGEGEIFEWLKEKNVDILEFRNIIIEKISHAEETIEEKFEEKKRPSSEMLEKFCINMTDMAEAGKFDPVIGREIEINRLSRVLVRRTKNNPVLTGEPGIGKTAIVEALAQRIVKGKVPAQLLNKTIYSLNLGSLIAGTRYRGELEERIHKILEELKQEKNIILFIDEIHSIMGAGESTDSPASIADQLKPALSRGEIRVIGATTAREYRRYIEKDAAMERRFQPINIEPPTIEETRLILKGLRDRYEAFHKVNISDEAIEGAIYYAERFINDRQFPDKAIDLIDEAAAKVKLESINNNDLEQTNNLHEQTAEAIRKGDFVEAARLKQQIHHNETTNDETKDSETIIPTITRDDIAFIISEVKGIPVYKISGEESNRLKLIEKELAENISGQPEAIRTVAKSIKRMRTGVKNINKPISMIFAGPTGTGKTEMAKTLAEFMFGDKDNLLVIDMSEFESQWSVNKLFGASPGYVGYEEGGRLTEFVNKNPYSVILFDEIEKAHPKTFDALLQILDSGRMTDGQGRTVNFKNTIIIMTTNLGGEELNKTALGFTTAENNNVSYSESVRIVNTALKKTFRPEFLNRIDETVVFSRLSTESLISIVDKFIRELNERILSLGYMVSLDDQAKKFLIAKGENQEQGARPIARIIQTEIEDKISDMIINNTIKPNQTVKITHNVEKDELEFTISRKKIPVGV
jgi:ATP-dependent Clp protease ATP-binding subunit ClpC